MGRGPGGGSSTYKIGVVAVYRHDQFKRRTTAVPNNNNNNNNNNNDSNNKSITLDFSPGDHPLAKKLRALVLRLS